MKNVLILANSSGGLYDFRNELVLELAKEYHVVASLPDTVKTALLEEEGVEIVHTPINRRGVNPFQDFKLLMNYKALLKKYDPAMVITYTIKPNVYGGMACAAAGVPYISTVTGLGSAFEKKGIFLQLIQLLYRYGMRKASCVFFQNRENRDIFMNAGLISGPTKMVPGSGVNVETHSFEPYPESDITQFLYVGRMMKEKGIRELLDAAEALHGDKVVFVLLGYCDEDWEKILEEKQSEGVIIHVPFNTNVHEFYRRASAVVMPTYHEGMSNVLMEASATGRPVIATNISGCREIFDDGVTGIGFAPRSSEALIQALKRFLTLKRSERAQMGAAAREKMIREFDRHQVAADYMEEIRKYAR